jgi:hypothetical protein
LPKIRHAACLSFLPPPFLSLPFRSRNHSTADLCAVAESCGPGRLPSRATTKCLWHLAKQSLPSFTRMQTPRGRKVSSLCICRWQSLAAWPGYRRTISHQSLWGHPCVFCLISGWCSCAPAAKLVLALTCTCPRSRAVDELVNMCDEVEDTLKHQIVQGERKGDGEYQLNVEARHTSLDPSQVPGAK